MAEVPKWVVDDAASIAEEAAPYVTMRAEERLQHLAAACRAAARLLELREDAQIALDYEDPLPESSLRALARLRAEARGPSHDAR